MQLSNIIIIDNFNLQTSESKCYSELRKLAHAIYRVSLSEEKVDIFIGKGLIF